jgi:hypothetical protein
MPRAASATFASLTGRAAALFHRDHRRPSRGSLFRAVSCCSSRTRDFATLENVRYIATVLYRCNARPFPARRSPVWARTSARSALTEDNALKRQLMGGPRSGFPLLKQENAG